MGLWLENVTEGVTVAVILLGLTTIWRWARSVDRRLSHIERKLHCEDGS